MYRGRGTLALPKAALVSGTFSFDVYSVTDTYNANITAGTLLEFIRTAQFGSNLLGMGTVDAYRGELLFLADVAHFGSLNANKDLIILLQGTSSTGLLLWMDDEKYRHA